MDIKAIEALMKAMERHGIESFEWKDKDIEVKLTKAFGAPAAANEAAVITAVTPGDDIETVDWGEIVESPVVGTYYAQPAPDEPPFVTVGSRVEKGQTICIVEAMKLLNEIAAPRSGVVKEIYAADGQKVEYGQFLMRISEE
jgi:acetyl-CoA carboxylase biotin carboxyl carrier protein